MYNFIQKLSFGVNILGLLIVDIFLWSTVSWSGGIAGLIGIGGFFVGYKISDNMIIARRDKWKLSEYDLFKKRLVYANSIAGSTIVIAAVILVFIETMITGA